MVFGKLEKRIAGELLSGSNSYANELFIYRPVKRPVYAESVLDHEGIIVCGPLHSPPIGAVYTTEKTDISKQLQLYLGDNLILAQAVPEYKGSDMHTLFLVNVPEPNEDIPPGYLHSFNEVPLIKEAPRKLIESVSNMALDTIVKLKTDMEKYVIFESEIGRNTALQFFKELEERK